MSQKSCQNAERFPRVPHAKTNWFLTISRFMTIFMHLIDYVG